MRGKCKLCGCEKELKLSHFIPKFIGRWSKKTSITGFLRESKNINKRVQDISKEYWLCEDCEGIFSKWETNFANKIFYPFVDDEKCESIYGEWLSRFCASISWRTLTYIRSLNKTSEKSKDYLNQIKSAEAHLSKFILGEADNLNQYEQHIFPVGKVESATGNPLPVNINRYFLRTMAMDIVGNSKDIFVYTKLPSFIILGLIKSSNSNKLRSSRVALKSGKLSPRDYHWPDGFIDYIIDKSNEVNTLSKETINPKIEKYMRENPEAVISSKLFEAFTHDYKMFGDKVFK